MATTGTGLAEAARSRPGVGVMPPSSSALHNSIRSAPPLSAAAIPWTLSTQTSSATASAMRASEFFEAQPGRADQSRFGARLSGHDDGGVGLAQDGLAYRLVEPFDQRRAVC